MSCSTKCKPCTDFDDECHEYRPHDHEELIASIKFDERMNPDGIGSEPTSPKVYKKMKDERQYKQPRNCSGVCGDGYPFDVADLCLPETDTRQQKHRFFEESDWETPEALDAKGPSKYEVPEHHSKKWYAFHHHQSMLLDERERRATCGFGTIILQGVVRQNYRNNKDTDNTRLMVLYDDGLLAWHLNEDDLRSGSPPALMYFVGSLTTEVVLGGKAILMKRASENVSFTLEICSGPDALAWHRAFDKARSENKDEGPSKIRAHGV